MVPAHLLSGWRLIVAGGGDGCMWDSSKHVAASVAQKLLEAEGIAGNAGEHQGRGSK